MMLAADGSHRGVRTDPAPDARSQRRRAGDSAVANAVGLARRPAASGPTAGSELAHCSRVARSKCSIACRSSSRGGGPQQLRDWCVSVEPASGSAEQLAEVLRRGTPCVWPAVEQQRVVIHLRGYWPEMRANRCRIHPLGTPRRAAGKRPSPRADVANGPAVAEPQCPLSCHHRRRKVTSGLTFRAAPNANAYARRARGKHVATCSVNALRWPIDACDIHGITPRSRPVTNRSAAASNRMIFRPTHCFF